MRMEEPIFPQAVVKKLIFSIAKKPVVVFVCNLEIILG